MKTAIALFGSYTNWYKKNEYKGDLFFYTYEKVYSDHCAVLSKVMSKSPIEEIPKFDKVKSVLEPSYLQNYFISSCKTMIQEYESENNLKYDIYIYTTFNSILTEFPSKQGDYHTEIYSFQKIPIKMNVLKDFKIVSNISVRFCGEPITFFNTLSLDLRKLIFDRLYKGRVCDMKNFSPEDRRSEELRSEVVLCAPEELSKITFLIPSVIHTSTNPFNYTERRSVFSPEERLKQTVKQVETLSHIANSKSYVLEGSELNFTELDQLSRYSSVILFSKDREGNHYANEHKNKSIYEIYLLHKLILKFDSEWIFKFGGRYHLHSSFRVERFLRDKPVFKVIPSHITFGNRPIVECVIYSLPKPYFETYFKIYEQIKERLLASSGSTENLLLEFSKEYYNIPSLGVIGQDAIEAFDKSI